ncbi:unnamed protein product [Pylaiella littoralis]
MSESDNALEEARREYAEAKSVALSAQLQEISVAKFEVDALPDKREFEAFFAKFRSRRRLFLGDGAAVDQMDGQAPAPSPQHGAPGV